MNQPLLYIVISVMYHLIPLTYQQDSCYHIQCLSDSPIESTTCVNKPIESIVKLSECKKGFYCKVDSEYPSKEFQCENNAYKPAIPRYEHLPCEKNSDCIHNVCSNHICNKTYYEDYTKCTKNSDCPYDESCQFFAYDHICIKLAPIGSLCDSSEECELSSACHNNVCTELYSLKNGEETGNEMLCKSGYIKDKKCSEVFLENARSPCDYDNKICNYIFDDGSKNIPEKCHCGFDSKGISYCELGESDSNNTAYYEALKKYYSRNICHSDERGKAPCLKDMISLSEQDKTEVGQLISTMVWAKKNYLMYEAEKCALKIFLPLYDEKYDDKERIPLDVSCPKYTCDDSKTPDHDDKTKTPCAKVVFNSFKDISVTLLDTCSSSQNCTINHWEKSFYKTQDIQCKDKTESLDHFPGEPCNNNQDCLMGYCNNGICEVIVSSCNDHFDCPAGKFCSSKRCKDQLKIGETCLTTFECQNNHYCHNGKCQDVLYTMKDGTTLPSLSYAEYPGSLCKSGYARNNICTSIISDDSIEPDEDYAECNYTSKCSYHSLLDKSDSWKEDCPCSFNPTEKHYCPHDHFQDSLLRERYLETLKKSFNNPCHTLRRHYCDLIDEDLQKELKMYQNKVDKGHYYYKSTKCAEKVLYGSYIRYSTLSFTIVLFILI